MDETRNANGTALADGDAATLVNDLKVKGFVLRTEFLKKV